MLWCLSIASGVASENSVEADQLQAEMRKTYHTQVVEKEIGD